MGQMTIIVDATLYQACLLIIPLFNAGNVVFMTRRSK